MNIRNIAVFFIILILINILPSYADVAPVPIIPTEFWINKKGMIVFPTEKQKTGNLRYNAHHDVNASYDEETNSIIYVDETGKVFYKINHDDSPFPINRFSEGLVAVEKDGRYGFINTKGEMVINPQFIPSICRNHANLKNKRGDIIRIIESCEMYFNDGLAPVSYDEQPEVYINNDRYSAVIPDNFKVGFSTKRYSNLSHPCYGEIRDGKFYIKNNPTREERKKLRVGNLKYKYKNGYIDKTGKVVIETDYKIVYPFQQGLALVQTKNGKYGYIDTTGKMVIKPKYKWASYFYNGIARVEVEKYVIALPGSILLLLILIITGFAIRRDMKKINSVSDSAEKND